MSQRPLVLIIDEDPQSYHALQSALGSQSVEVLWSTSPSTLPILSREVSIVLYGVSQHTDYEIAFDVHKRFEQAPFFIVAEQHLVDAFEARNAGAVGTFVKPLRVVHLHKRLIELLPQQVTAVQGQLDDVYIPQSHHRQAKLLSFLPSTPVQDDLEALVEELLPLVVEQVLRIQLSAQTQVRRQLQDDIRTLIREELTKMKGHEG